MWVKSAGKQGAITIQALCDRTILICICHHYLQILQEPAGFTFCDHLAQGHTHPTQTQRQLVLAYFACPLKHF